MPSDAVYAHLSALTTWLILEFPAKRIHTEEELDIHWDAAKLRNMMLVCATLHAQMDLTVLDQSVGKFARMESMTVALFALMILKDVHLLSSS